MRRNRKNGFKKERIIMIASSAFVLAALTLTGVYMSEQNEQSQDDGYTLDFTALEDGAEDKLEEIAKQNPVEEETPDGQVANGQNGIQKEVTEDDLDYMPLEVDSGQITIPGLTDQQVQDGTMSEEEVSAVGELPSVGNELQNEPESVLTEQEEEPDESEDSREEAASENVVAPARTLSFSEEEGILRPVSGDILMHYSMSKSIYFATLDQYKYNPAVILTAEQGTAVSAAAEGKVTDIYDDRVTGKTLVMDLGTGYQAVYGQLAEVNVSVGSYVDEGDILAKVAAPTKYYSVEGNNLYFALKKDGVYVNPETLFR